MTKEQAIEELKRCAELCPTTPLAEACRMAVAIMRTAGEAYIQGYCDGGNVARRECANCRHADRMPGVYPCNECEEKYSDAPSRWEPKEVDT